MKLTNANQEDFRQISVQYQGFHPSDYVVQHIGGLLDDLYEEAPYGATIRATVTKRNDTYKAMLSIHSAVGPFFAVAASPSLRELSDQLFSRAHRRIEKWKSKRFRKAKGWRQAAQAEKGYEWVS